MSILYLYKQYCINQINNVKLTNQIQIKMKQLEKILIRKFTNPSLIILSIIALFSLNTTNAQVGIGTTSPDASASLELQSTTKGFLPPRMDTDARNNINSPAEGLMIYNIENGCLEFWNNSFWVSACDGSAQLGSTADCATSGFIPPYLTADQTEIVDVTNPVTNQTWMDRNLGAYTADRTSPSAAGGTDCWAYGNLYQWGRNSDGHEDRNSSTASGPLAAGSEGSNFITVGSSPFDWLSTPDDDRWNANETSGGSVVKTVNDPCPSGYRVPTQAEWEAEWDSWDGTLHNTTPPSSNNNIEGAITSPLKLPVAGQRNQSTGELSYVGTLGFYWSSTVSGTQAERFYFHPSGVIMSDQPRALGHSVRCLKD